MNVLLDMKDVSKRLDAVQLLDKVSIKVYEGEFFSILGASGAGKTTLLRIIGGFDYVDSGDILLNGESIASVPAYSRPVHTVFQDYALFPHMNVFDNVAFGLRVKGVPEDVVNSKVLGMLDLVRLSLQSDRMPGNLSGGQQQRVAIARALVNNPKILLLDEPLSALDYHLRKHMLLELKEIQRKVGTTFIFVTHDQSDALAVSDRIAVLSNGKILDVGSPREIYNKPSALSVAEFVGEVNVFYGKARINVTDNKATQAVFDIVDMAVQLTFKEQGKIGHVLNKSACICVRPESVRIIKDTGNTAGLKGKISKLVFGGFYIRVGIDIGKMELQAFLFKGNPYYKDIVLGDLVHVSWEEEDALVLETR